LIRRPYDDKAHYPKTSLGSLVVQCRGHVQPHTSNRELTGMHEAPTHTELVQLLPSHRLSNLFRVVKMLKDFYNLILADMPKCSLRLHERP